eukprot:3337035-Amphidinium_carterae.2
MQPSWNSDTRQLTKQYYKWLEDINRFESENGPGTINDHVKTATVVNNLKGDDISRGSLVERTTMRTRTTMTRAMKRPMTRTGSTTMTTRSR